MGLAFPRTTTVRTEAILIARHRTGAIVRQVVSLAWPMLKSGAGQVYSDSEGSYRWITVHPHGSDEKGQPVKIRESKTQPGTWHVVAGAGGKLNYLRLTGVKTPEEYKAQTADKRRAKKEAEQARREEQKARRKSLSKEERQAETEAKKLAQNELSAKRGEITLAKREAIHEMAQELGWENIGFEDQAKRLEATGAKPERIDQLETAHYKRLWQRLEAVRDQSHRALLTDPERAKAVLNDLPVTASEDDPTPALEDFLEAPKPPTGKGYKEDTGERARRNLLAEAAAVDHEQLNAELARERERLDDKVQAGGITEEEAAAVRELAARAHVASLVHAAQSTTPEAIAAERATVQHAVERTLKERAAHLGWLSAAEERWRELKDKNPNAEMPKALAEMRAFDEKLASDVQSGRERLTDLAVMAGESDAPAVQGEKQTLATKRVLEREQEIAAEGGDPEAYRMRLEMFKAASERYRREIKRYKDLKILEKPQAEVKPIADPAKVVELTARLNKIAQAEREIARMQTKVDKGDLDDLKIFGKGKFADVGRVTPEDLAATKAKLENTVHEAATRAFLTRAEHGELLTGRGAGLLGPEDQQTLRRTLDRHLSSGAFNVLNNAGLATAKAPVLNRETVDVLGAAGSAELLAWALHHSEDKATLREFAAGIEEYHVKENVERAEERLRELDEALDKADEAVAALHAPEDIAAAVEANQARQAALEEARQIMGTALGEYEATAALAVALKQPAATEIHTNLGPIDAATAIRQMRSLGLGRGDYELTSDGVNHFATVRESGFAKLAQPPDPDHVALYEDVMAIKRGDRDETGWQPKGGILRTGTSLNADALHAEPLSTKLPAIHELGAGGDMPGALKDYVGLRLADGHDIHDIIADLTAASPTVPDERRGAFLEAFGNLLPAREPIKNEKGEQVYVTDAKTGDIKLGPDGEPMPAMQPIGQRDPRQLRELAESALRARGLSPEAAGIHAQQVDLNDERTHEALFRTLAADPRRMVAFKHPGELTSDDQRALRHYFATSVARDDNLVAKAEIKRRLEELGPEPTRYETGGLFGDQVESEDYRGWQRARNAILEDAHTMRVGSASSSWDTYVRTLGGTHAAYAALQEQLRGGVARDFHRHYTVLTRQPLALGATTYENGFLNAGYMNPQVREQLRKEGALERAQAARRDVAGRYAEGTIAEKLQTLRARKQSERENQVSLLGATPERTDRREPDAFQRHTLGRRLEAQLGSLMPNVARNFQPGEPIKLFADKSFDGKYVHQQRVIKQFLRSKRFVNATGTGSGKTSMMIGALAHARQTPSTGVKRGLFLVPSSVQGQFGGEFARFADPRKMTWAANPGGDRAQRLAEHASADTHAVVHTHQAFRDDMLHLLGKAWGTDDAATKDRFMKLDRKGAAAAMRDVWKQHGIDYQMISVDEGHQTLDRAGKADSFLSRVVQAATDNAAYYHSASADPIKNDISELRSLLDKLHPDGRYSDDGAWQRRYGVNTTAAAEALKREVAPWIYAAHIESGNDVVRRTETVPLHESQQKQYAATMGAFQGLRAARVKGDVKAALGPAKILLGDRMPTDPAEAEAAARALMQNAGAAKEQALARIIDAAPPAENAKIQKLVGMLKEHDPREKPVVVFAHRLDAVGHIADALGAAGHRVVTLTGADSTAERDRKRRMFMPETGAPEADVFVLSDAGEAGLNLQRGHTLVQYDRPMTAKTHAQRNGRIDRLGQQNPEIHLVDLTTDSPFEARAAERIQQKYGLRNTVTDPATGIDDSGMAHLFAAARQRAVDAQKRTAA